ncbi:MAG: hypothetical protein ABSG21_17920 [Spirochaetia bacterium]
MNAPRQRGFCVPWDLQAGRTENEALALARDLVGRYGDLLYSWVGIRGAASDLAASGLQVARMA